MRLSDDDFGEGTWRGPYEDTLEAPNRQKAVMVREPFVEDGPAMALGDTTTGEYITCTEWVDLSDWPEFDDE